MAKHLQRLLTIAGTWLSRPRAVLYAVFWRRSKPGSFGWHGAVIVATLLMTLFIQRAEYRDTQAIHAKFG